MMKGRFACAGFAAVVALLIMSTATEASARGLGSAPRRLLQLGSFESIFSNTFAKDAAPQFPTPLTASSFSIYDAATQAAQVFQSAASQVMPTEPLTSSFASASDRGFDRFHQAQSARAEVYTEGDLLASGGP